MPKKIKEAKKVKNEDRKPRAKASSVPPVAEVPVATRIATKAEQMKAHLEKQPQISILVPLERGEKKGAVQPFCLNGYRFTVPKGVMTMVPEQVAKMIAERFEVELEVRSKSLGQQSLKTQKALE